MTETWHGNVPVLTNQIINDVPDIAEDILYLGRRFGYIADPTEVDQGVAGSGRSIVDHLTAIGTTKTATIFLPHHAADGNTTTYTIATNLTCASYPNVFFLIQPGAIITPSTGITFTAYSPANIVAAPNQQIFSGAGTVAFSSGGDIYPEWWGGGTGATAAANVTAFTAAFAKKLPVICQAGTYNFNAALTATDVPALRGVTGKTILTPSAALVTGSWLTWNNTTAGGAGYAPLSVMEGISVNGAATTGTTGVKVGGATANTTLFRGVDIYGFVTGLNVYDQVRFTAENCDVSKNGGNVLVNASASYPTVVMFRDCQIRQADTALGTGIGASLDHGYNIFFDNCIFEGNDKEGIKGVIGTDEKLNVGLSKCWFEGNQVSEGTPANYYDIVMDGTGYGTTGRIDFRAQDCHFSAATTKCISLSQVSHFEIGPVYTSSGMITDCFNFASSCYGKLDLQNIHSNYSDNITDDGSNQINTDGNWFVEAFAANDATPSVVAGTLFKTANTNPTTITRFDGGYAGKRFIVYFNDTQTTIAFSGGGYVRGNAHTDVTFVVGDCIDCTMIQVGSDLVTYCTVQHAIA